MLVLVRAWDTGVKADPWAVVGTAGLVGDGELRALFEGVREEKELEGRLKGRRFRLGRFEEGGEEEYGIVVASDGGTTTPPPVTVRKANRVYPRMPFVALKKWSRGVFVAVLAAMMGWLAFYFQPLPDTPFELFMDSQGFGGYDSAASCCWWLRSCPASRSCCCRHFWPTYLSP